MSFLNKLWIVTLGIVMTLAFGATITQTSFAASRTGTLKTNEGKCLDNSQWAAVNRNKILAYQCTGGGNQKWTANDDGTLRVQGYCLDVPGASKRSYTYVQLYQCNGSAAQKWTLDSDNTIVNPNSWLCLEPVDSASSNSRVWVVDCNGSAKQKWNFSGNSESQPNPNPNPTPSGNTGGSGGELSDQTFKSFSSDGYTSRYHLYAAGLDWSKPVGVLIYADGSGEYGLKNPGSTYLMSGSNGLIATAKNNNMILLTPFSPNTACSDGDGSCWYLGDPVGYAKWAESLVRYVYGRYPVDKSRIAFGGYSSGAQLATEYWVPSGAAQRTMSDGVVVAISYGGSPKMTQVNYTADFKSKVHMNWNVGSRDSAYTTSSSYGVKAGYNYYTNNGFSTSLKVIDGLGHSRSGQFGGIMNEQIKTHLN